MEYKIEIGEHNRLEKVDLILNEDEEAINIKKKKDQLKDNDKEKMIEVNLPKTIEETKSTKDDSTEMVIKTKIHGKKIWLDDHSKNRPDSIIVYLLADGELHDRKVVTARDHWEYSFNNIPLYDSSGEKIHYQIKEKAVEGYESKVVGHQLENLRVGKVEAKIVKNWPSSIDTEKIEDIKIDLIQNGKKIKEVELSSKRNWEYTFSSLDKYDAFGKRYHYQIDEPISKANQGHPAKLVIDNEDLPNKQKGRNTGIALIAGTILAAIGLASQIKNKLKK